MERLLILCVLGLSEKKSDIQRLEVVAHTYYPTYVGDWGRRIQNSGQSRKTSRDSIWKTTKAKSWGHDWSDKALAYQARETLSSKTPIPPLPPPHAPKKERKRNKKPHIPFLLAESRESQQGVFPRESVWLCGVEVKDLIGCFPGAAGSKKYQQKGWWAML
jgi:hypothetical protein